jgi:hypothetical protein
MDGDAAGFAALLLHGLSGLGSGYKGKMRRKAA